MYPKFTVLVNFRAQCIAEKLKILLKNKISAKTTSLGISNNVSKSQVPKKSHNSCKIKQKIIIFLGPDWI